MPIGNPTLIDEKKLITQRVPQGKAVPVPLNFQTDSSFSLKLQNLADRDLLPRVLAVYIDNANNASAVSVIFSATGQTITMAPNRQGFKTALAYNRDTVLFNSLSAASITVLLLDFPVVDCDWPCATGA